MDTNANVTFSNMTGDQTRGEEKTLQKKKTNQTIIYLGGQQHKEGFQTNNGGVTLQQFISRG